MKTVTLERRLPVRGLLAAVAALSLVAAVLLGSSARVGVSPASAAPVTVWGVTANGQLISFASNTPGTVLSSVPITGLLTQEVAGTVLTETIVGIDVRPSTGVLYAVGFVSSSQHVYTINTATGVATPVSQTSFNASLAGSNFGVAFDPVLDEIRLISPFGLHLRLSPTTGQVTGTESGFSGVNGLTGASHAPGSSCVSPNALFVIDSQADTLNSVSSPGTLTPVGPLGVTAADRIGFDIAPDGSAYASIKLSIVATDPVGFFSVNLATGAATLVGNIGGGNQVTAIALQDGPPPPPPTPTPAPTPSPKPGTSATPAPTSTPSPAPTRTPKPAS